MGTIYPDPAYDATPTIREAFTAAGFGFSTDTLPPAGMGFGTSLPNAPYYLSAPNRSKIHTAVFTGLLPR